MKVLEKGIVFVGTLFRDIRERLFYWPPRCPQCDSETYLVYQLFADDGCEGGYLIYSCPRCGADVPYSLSSGIHPHL